MMSYLIIKCCHAPYTSMLRSTVQSQASIPSCLGNHKNFGVVNYELMMMSLQPSNMLGQMAAIFVFKLCDALIRRHTQSLYTLYYSVWQVACPHIAGGVVISSGSFIRAKLTMLESTQLTLQCGPQGTNTADQQSCVQWGDVILPDQPLPEIAL